MATTTSSKQIRIWSKSGGACFVGFGPALPAETVAASFAALTSAGESASRSPSSTSPASSRKRSERSKEFSEVRAAPPRSRRSK